MAKTIPGYEGLYEVSEDGRIGEIREVYALSSK